MARHLITLALCLGTSLARAHGGEPPARPLTGLTAPVELSRDRSGVVHVQARNEADLWFMQGFVHARDRLFQMDEFRRTASGTLAELLGTAALASDVQLRTLGLRRAAERSLAALSPEARATLEAFARGVNAYLAAYPLPMQYAALEITRVAPWTPLDSVVIGKLFAVQLSLETDIDSTLALAAYQRAGALAGFDGKALYFDDLDRVAPLDPAATIPDAMQRPPRPHSGHHGPHRPRAADSAAVEDDVARLAKRWREQLRQVPALRGVMQRDHRAGSNLWAVSGRLTDSGRPLIANDKHLPLTAPGVWYPIGLSLSGPGGSTLRAAGDSFAGVPALLGGYNQHIAWGGTNSLFDVTDTYQERLVPDATSPSGLSSVYQGRLEPVIPIPETYRANQPGDGVPDNLVTVPAGGAIPAVTLLVPRHGPVVQFDATTGTALTLQWAGAAPTREVDALLRMVRATTVDEFKAALQFFDVGAQNWVVADGRGDLGYFTSGEVPVREDLQAGYVDGLPPHFIRNGQGGNEWLPVRNPQPQQALPYEVLPFAELPQIVNPPAGFLVNGNNDPLGVTRDNNPFNETRPGGGIYYLSFNFNDSTGLRAGQITARLKEVLSRRRVRFEDMQAIQSDSTIRDAQVLLPHLLAAFDRARRPGALPALAALAAQPGVAEAAWRLRRWDFTSPTGLTEGWDADKPAGRRPDADSIRASVAATLYNLWRSRLAANTVDRVVGGAGLPVPEAGPLVIALGYLLQSFPQNGGRGASGLDFFPVPGVAAAEDRRDLLLLQSLDDALTLAASDTFKPAFGNSTNLADYRWGKLHRVELKSDLGAPFTLPSPGSVYPPPLPGRAGIPVDGGYQTVDVAGFEPRAARPDDFISRHAASQRLVAEVAPWGTSRVENIWPGGLSEQPGGVGYARYLNDWLGNQAVPLRLQGGEAVERFRP
ncbi:penicillin acylase family protein [Roseateles cellulosilyticus]|uniref:Penicillin acylase family protein n=1 Tax=Pelomonas cellulosilytica TaxID=2906762 RepID=A0ABS8XU60_9BURK|nr:penicillin acylase family protein [Pelomonas sp. P8]MCE4556217.1 penicillin acylase family protein [Pelomonas sp. P8]